MELGTSWMRLVWPSMPFRTWHCSQSGISPYLHRPNAHGWKWWYLSRKLVCNELRCELTVVRLRIRAIKLLPLAHVSRYTTCYVPRGPFLERSCTDNPWAPTIFTFDRVPRIQVQLNNGVRAMMLNENSFVHTFNSKKVSNISPLTIKFVLCSKSPWKLA
jgi:hypothetical protein